MSIPGVGPSIAGQVAQEVTVSLCGRFVNLFQNRIAAVAAIALTSVVGMIGGLICADVIVNVFDKKGSIQLIYASVLFSALTVMVSKCLKLPFSPLATGAIAAVTAVLTLAVLIKSK